MSTRRRSRALGIAATTLAALAGTGMAAGVPAAASTPDSASVRPDPRVGARCSADASLLGFSDALDNSTFQGTAVAGLSALDLPAPPTTWWGPFRPRRALALVDNIDTTPARMYDLTLDARPRNLEVEVHGVTILRRPDGTPYTGADFDGEGLVVERWGRTVLASSEVEPSIRRFRRSDGRQVDELEVPARFRVAPGGEAEENQTFEALAATPDERTLYAGMEGPLASDGRDADDRGLQRILRYDREPGADYVPSAQYAYRTDPGLGLAELVSFGSGRLLALERGYVGGFGNTIRIHRVHTGGAPDVTGVASLADSGPGVFVDKELVVDLVTCPPSGATAKQPQPNPLLDNIEGMALGRRLPMGRQELYLVSDNNHNPVQTTRVYRLAIDRR